MTTHRWVAAILVSLLALVPSSALAQAASAADPTLLVLEPIGAPDPSLSAQVTASLTQVGQTLGYRVVTAGAGSVIGALSPAASTDLVGLTQRSGVFRTIVVWLVPATAGYDVQVGIASADGSAASLRTTTSASGITDVATRLAAAALPAPTAALSAPWGSGAVLSGAPATSPPVVASAPTVATTSYGATPYATTPYGTTPYGTSAEPRPSRPSHHREAGLLIAGGIVLGVGWVLELFVGLFGGYHDRTCWFGSCPSGTSWDPAWDDFRAASLVPIAGPWIQLAVKPPSDDAWPQWLVADGIIQGAGAILMIVGIAIWGSGSDEEPPPVAVLPMLGPSTAGLTVLGRL